MVGRAQPVERAVIDARALRYRQDPAAAGIEEDQLTVAHLDREAMLVDQQVVVSARQVGIFQAGLATVDPVAYVMSVEEPAMRAAGPAAMLVAGLQGTAKRRRDGAGLAANVDGPAVSVLEQRHHAGIAQ